MGEEYTRRPFYGSRKMLRWLPEQGYQVGRDPGSQFTSEKFTGVLVLSTNFIRTLFCKATPPQLSTRGQGHQCCFLDAEECNKEGISVIRNA